MDKKVSEKVAKILLDVKAVSLNPKKPFRYASGILSPVYTDCRLLMGHPKERRIIRDFYIDAIRSIGNNIQMIAGTATAGIPHAAWIAEELKLPMIYARSKPKAHGKGNQVEGVLKKGQQVAVIEDLISTGESSSETVKAVRNAGAKATHIFAIITYGMKKSKDNFKKYKIKLVYLTDFPTVVSVAQKYNYIKKGEQKIVLDWIQDPAAWSKRMGFE